jgi:hypothetical protein
MAACLILALSLAANNVFPHWKETNSCSRLYLTLAIVEDGSLSIDGPLARYGDTQDKARYADHFYTDKAPGYSFLLVPLAWLLRATWVAPDDYNQLAWWLRALGLSLPSAWFWWWSMPRWQRLTGNAWLAAPMALAGALATPWAIYSAQLFAHVPAGILLFVAWALVVPCDDTPRGSPVRAALASGVLSGLAFTCDYMVFLAVPIVLLTTWWAYRTARWQASALFCLGLLLPLLAWAAYNQACFEHPLRVGFQQHADAQYGDAYRSGWMGIQLPSSQALLGLLWSPARGLFYFAPMLLLAFPGWLVLSRDRATRLIAWSSAGICLAIYLFALTTVDWRGGWAFGPRYLVPLIPFACVGVAGCLRAPFLAAMRTLFVALALVGLLWGTLATATFALFPTEFANPCRSVLFPFAFNGLTAPNLLSPASNSLGALLIYLGGITAAWFIARALDPNQSGFVMRLVAAPTLAAAILAWQCLLPDHAVSPRDQAILRAQLMTRLGHFQEASYQLLALPEEAAP